ncbi:rod-determining factor RdfA [Halomarina pelagica]|uniref:rod-determining factor RdfA n=1 Tax=Halomarina pelagica TaxID=2961599 RepID=UPI0020C4FD43|nr:rod-determining factor RdfA [Halomarina sp. BND7]
MPDGSTEETEGGGETNYGDKVRRVSEKYGLGDVEAELLTRRTGDGVERHSLRELAAYVNRRLLDAALKRAGENPLDGEVSNLYRLLTSDEVTEGTRTQAINRLTRRGVDAEALRDDFVSYQTVNRYLDGVAPAPRAPPANGTDHGERISKLQARLEAVTGSSLDQLRRGDDFALGPYDVLVDVTVTCRECGLTTSVHALLDRGGCDCRPDA